nr:MAG TPA: hypothetical protein [Caudoviricetes sp.]
MQNFSESMTKGHVMLLHFAIYINGCNLIF